MATYVFSQGTVEAMVAEGLGVADDDELHASAGDGDVHAAQVAQESYLPRGIVAHQADDDNVALLPLEAVDASAMTSRWENLGTTPRRGILPCSLTKSFEKCLHTSRIFPNFTKKLYISD